MVRYYMRASGQVQGVGFRYFVKQSAELFSLTGWVRNLDSGDVDMEVQGSEAEIEAFTERIREGSRFIEVAELEILPLDVIDERSFEISDWF